MKISMTIIIIIIIIQEVEGQEIPVDEQCLTENSLHFSRILEVGLVEHLKGWHHGTVWRLCFAFLISGVFIKMYIYPSSTMHMTIDASINKSENMQVFKPPQTIWAVRGGAWI